jgi:hypothetical protein
VYNHIVKTILKEKAVKLRRNGYTYSDINKKLKKNIPKSTLSKWFKNLTLSPKQNTVLRKNISDKLIRSQQKAWRVNKKRRVEYLKSLKDKNIYLLQFLNKDIQKLLLSILYLGEGAKSKSTEHLSLGSSSASIIRLYLSFLKTCFKIDNSKFRVRIQCRADQNIKDLENYWQHVTGIQKKQFYLTYIDKRTINKPTLYKNYKGVCTIMYFDRSIQFELEFLANSVIKYLNRGR